MLYFKESVREFPLIEPYDINGFGSFDHFGIGEI